MDDLYRDEILDHYQHPRHQGKITQVPKGAQLLKAHASNHGCGDDIEADLVIKDGVVVDLAWTGTGCAISQASMSLVSEWAVGKPLNEVTKLSKEKILEFISLPEIASAREKCALIPLQIFSPHTGK